MNGVIGTMSMNTPAANKRRAYQAPRLSVLGDVGSLTETGSQNGQEDGYQNNMCNGCVAPINTMFNMC